MAKERSISRRDMLRGRFVESLFHGPGRSKPSDGPQKNSSTNDLPPRPQPEGTARYRQAFPVLRPPGAIEEQAFLNGCTRCNACIEACPHDAIIHAPLRFRNAAGTPMIDPMKQPCWMCADFPCIAACEPNVLRAEMPKTMGVARVEIFSCLAYTGSFCTVCSERCPIEGAIEVKDGKPRIIEDRCTGCGVCQHVCPAPSNAILLMPLKERPLPDSSPGA